MMKPQEFDHRKPREKNYVENNSPPLAGGDEGEGE
jgi:hypothetical protein